MKFGIREVADLTFKRISGIGPDTFRIDTAKMSTLEGQTTTVYAQGGAGNSRLAAWEGEKNLTFTIEDALMTLESMSALMGSEIDQSVTGHKKLTIAATNFAGYYEVTAETLFRETETGIDCPTTIHIPKAKLQTTLNIPMSPTGDPATFTFTFDAFPAGKDKTLCTIDINTAEAEAKLTDDVFTTSVILHANELATGEKLTVTGDYPYIAVEMKNSKYIVVLEGDDTKQSTTIQQDAFFNLTDGESQFRDKILKPGRTYHFTVC